MSITFALQKFNQYLYGRKFILVTDHRPLLSLFNPSKATTTLVAYRLAHWALMSSQYDYTIEYRKTSHHGNDDVLSRLPNGPDVQFDEGEMSTDYDTVCTVRTISKQID